MQGRDSEVLRQMSFLSKIIFLGLNDRSACLENRITYITHWATNSLSAFVPPSWVRNSLYSPNHPHKSFETAKTRLI